MSMPELDELNEEFNNFMYKVNQVSDIVQKLSSNDKHLQEIGNLEAKQYLGETDEDKYSNLDENDVQIKIKNNRTVINKKALLRDDNPDTQSQESFMEEVSKDANKRYKEKLIRKERMETFKKQATMAFRRGEYEKALTLYNKAIEQIRDSCMLYSNRALTYINLKFYDKAINDCETALKLNENSLRARLLLAKAFYLAGQRENFEKCIKEAKEKNTDNKEFIDGSIDTNHIDSMTVFGSFVDFIHKLSIECKE